MSKSSSNPLYERKAFPFKVKAVDDEQGLIEAYGSVFDNEDLGSDIIRAGSFKRTIQNAKSKVQAGKANFLAAMLWNHDIEHFLPIGGWYELKEDGHGLLGKGRIAIDTQLGHDVYKLIKGKFVDEFSIGFDIPQGGSKYDPKTGIRELTELRLYEISPVVFAMNPEALLVGVKSASGKTSWPLADRDEAWDGSAAHNQIVKWATKEDDTLDESKMKSVHFWYDESAPDKIGSYKLAFCYIKDGNPVAVPRGIFACTGGHGLAVADIPESDVDGVKAKIAKYYSRMAKAFDDDTLVPPWKNTDKSKVNSMNKKSKKDFNDHYRDEVIEDWLNTDFNNLTCALRAAILDMFSIGDEPQSDIETTVLNDGDDSPGFITALKAYVQKGIDLDVSNYLNEIQQQGTGYGSPYYLMSRGKPNQTKEGRVISATNQQVIQDHVKSMHDLADKGMDVMREHAKAVRTAADDLATRLQGSEPTYASPNEGTPDEGTQEGKSATPSHHETRSTQTQHSSEKDTAMNEQELDAAIRLLKSLQGTYVHS